MPVGSPPLLSGALKHREVWVGYRNGRHGSSLLKSVNVQGVVEIPDPNGEDSPEGKGGEQKAPPHRTQNTKSQKRLI